MVIIMQKIYKIFKENLSKTAIDLMYYGTGLSFGLLIVGICAFNFNKAFWGDNFNNSLWSIKIITSAMSLFVQSFFFALIFDCVRLSKK